MDARPDAGVKSVPLLAAGRGRGVGTDFRVIDRAFLLLLMTGLMLAPASALPQDGDAPARERDGESAPEEEPGEENAGETQADEDNPLGEPDRTLDPPDEREDVDYDVEIAGVPNEDLREKFKALSAVASRSTTYRSRAAVRRAATGETKKLANFLQAEGYYAAAVQAQFRRAQEKMTVVFTVQPGPKFRVTDYRIVYLDPQRVARPKTLEAAGVSGSGSPGGAELKRIQSEILAALQN